MIDKKAPMALGDIFNNAFVLIKDTIVRNLIIAAVFLIPAAIIFTYGFEGYVKLIDTANQYKNANGAQNINPAQIGSIFLGFFEFFCSIVVFYLALMGCWIGIIKTICSEVDGIKISLKEAFGEVFSLTFFRCLGLFLLGSLALIGIYIVIIIFFAIAVVVKVFWAGLIAGLVIAALVLLMIYLVNLWYFAPVNIVYEYQGIKKAFSKSASLVKGYWWRTFGTIILISIIIGFASAVVSGPITFLFEWDFITQYFQIITHQKDISLDPAVALKMLESLGFTYGLIIGLSTIIQALTYPVFYVVLYFDLKIKKNDFPPEIIEESNIVEGETPVE